GGTNEYVGSFESLHATDEQEEFGVLPQADTFQRGPSITWCEVLQVDTGWDGADPVLTGPVVLSELVRLVVGVGDEPVGLADQLVLAPYADFGFSGVTLGQRGVLDAGHGVHALDEGHTPPAGSDHTRTSDHPVMAVDVVVVARFALSFGTQHPEEERTQVRGKDVLVQEAVGTRRNAMDVHPGDEFDDRGQIRA